MNNKIQKKLDVLFIHQKLSSFVNNDVIMLRKKFHVRNFHYKATKNIIEQLKDQFILFIWLSIFIWRARYIFIWFADYHSFLPVLFARFFGKKSFLVLGGYDVAFIPDLDYGSYKNKYRAAATSFSISNATLVLPVADNLMDEARARVPDARIKVVYTGFDPQKFVPTGAEKKSLILTVSAGDTLQRIKLKGIDFFIKLAQSLPLYRFAVVGIGENAIGYLGEIPANLTVYSFLSDQSLLKLFQEAKVYGQFSLREGLPTAVCEAMLCECIPVGFRNGGIPIAIGDCGFLMDSHDFDAACDAIDKAIKMGPELGQRARQRVIDNFSLERRQNVLFELMSDYNPS